MRIDTIGYLRDHKIQTYYDSYLSLGITPDPYVRPEYALMGHTSVNAGATDFGKSVPTARNIAEQADQQVPHDQSFAPAADAAGDKAQANQTIQTIAPGDGAGPLQGADWKKYCDRLGQRESGNDYSKVNTIGYSGRWQFGADALAEQGYVRPGTSVRRLGTASNWTGKDGLNSREAFLSNTAMQDKIMLIYTQRHYKTLLRLRVISESSTKADVAGWLATAHLKGPGGAQKLKNGQDNADAYGTNASDYYKMMSSEFGGTNNDPISAAKSGAIPENSPTDAATVAKNVQPDSANFNFPSSDAAPKYPHNKITEYESGHFKEYDSTPGNERIQERHKSGTGYEIQADGTKREIVTKSRYTAVMGNDYILINGTCQVIVNGDCGLRVNGNLNHSIANDYNLNIGGKFNVVVSGDHLSTVQGSEQVNIQGDASRHVSGFYNVGVDGDTTLSAASVSSIAMDGDNIIGATNNITMAAKVDIKLNAAANVNIVAGSGIAALAKGAVGIIGTTGALFGAAAGKATLYSTDESVVFSDGPVKLDGSAVNASPKVDRAEWADRGGVVQLAEVLGGIAGVAPPEVPSGGAPGTQTAVTEGTKYSNEESIDNAFLNFTPIDMSKTQAYASGEGELQGYKGGLNYEAQSTTA